MRWCKPCSVRRFMAGTVTPLPTHTACVGGTELWCIRKVWKFPLETGSGSPPLNLSRLSLLWQYTMEEVNLSLAFQSAGSCHFGIMEPRSTMWEVLMPWQRGPSDSQERGKDPDGLAFQSPLPRYEAWQWSKLGPSRPGRPKAIQWPPLVVLGIKNWPVEPCLDSWHLIISETTKLWVVCCRRWIIGRQECTSPKISERAPVPVAPPEHQHQCKCQHLSYNSTTCQR